MISQTSQPALNYQSLNTIEDCLAFIQNLDASLMKMGMTRIKAVLAALGQPQDAYKTIHVVGTNGKGSTCTMLESVYRTAGYKTGLFTSPHLIDVRERVKINNELLPDAILIDTVNHIRTVMATVLPAREDWLTYFEFITVLGFLSFQKQQVDIAIIEAGLGGRLDGTNVISQPEAIIVTSISYDHQAILGETLAEIALEKAGVFRANVPVLTLKQHLSDSDVILAVLNREAIAHDSTLILTDKNQIVFDCMDLNAGTQNLITPYGPLSTRMLGRYQMANMILVMKAIEAVTALPVSRDDVLKGLSLAQWPARMQWLPAHKIIIDGSHNIEGLNALVETLSVDFSEFTWTIGLSLLKTKKLSALNALGKLGNIHKIIILNDLTDAGAGYYHPSELSDAIRHAFDSIGHPVFIEQMSLDNFLSLPVETTSEIGVENRCLKLLTGSLYTAGDALKRLSTQ